ncbi:MAG: lytic transglycosylase domain-containing protein [Candidatus Tectomicrobia bacterium]|uniref:Lytic transglycosylase domain-containing protein n=1 Tax=Tectimicrobiota bacterium TaxID=2528274 RepID=A0A933GPT4_UNCTE|nr:lytic transglycosylase domain-containing protein [Candidatus Tectomicrobia bacterium]
MSIFTPLVVSEGGEIYRYVTPDGIVVYTNWPPLYPPAKKESSFKSAVYSIQTPKEKNNFSKPPAEYFTLIREIANNYGVDPNLIHAIIRVESNFDPGAVSPKGAMGIMQLMPDTARSNKVNNPFSPIQNVDGGTRHFRYLLNSYKHDLDLALAAYNAGEGAVNKYGGVPPYRETKDFITKVKSLYHSQAKIKGTELYVVKVDGVYLITDSPTYTLPTSISIPPSTKSKSSGKSSGLTSPDGKEKGAVSRPVP